MNIRKESRAWQYPSQTINYQIQAEIALKF